MENDLQLFSLKRILSFCFTFVTLQAAVKTNYSHADNKEVCSILIF